MSPTSYQAAPPRNTNLTQGAGRGQTLKQKKRGDRVSLPSVVWCGSGQNSKRPMIRKCEFEVPMSEKEPRVALPMRAKAPGVLAL